MVVGNELGIIRWHAIGRDSAPSFGNVIPFAITLRFSEGLSGRAAVARGGGDEPFTFDFGFLNIEEQVHY